MNYRLKKISGDASDREFYRLYKDTNTSIIIKTKKNKFKNLIVYSLINNILRKNHIIAPRLINKYFKQGIIEISDLGEKTFFDLIKSPKKNFSSYKKLIDIICKIQKIKIKNKYNFFGHKIEVKKYDLPTLNKESNLFFDWYLSYYSKIKNKSKLKKKIKKELTKIYSKLKFDNDCFVHRDFHASNIVVSKNKMGLIDSQDAIIGNRLYDVVSLIDDVRVKIPNTLKQKILNYYLKKTKLNKFEKNNLQNDFDILSVQRNLKILGIFVRLSIRDKKPYYIKFLPYTRKLINLRLKNPIFYNIRKELKLTINSRK